ncbi:bifunctional diaminohydroxyphosphoribosylaminopyrimidine deaminase/5-amino-6-(5-phosphoribosylamino)uracil reductase RibD [bacterium]|nr:MAG: bifunctional diaminohydroxyphosphoribosylaminopyrimidine deaminase/5-amino-6-(5-phosphoribosylamino)uracil reductase RibD [bacterium]RKZ17141.1 MAG: bifunctional diaminohydroxyphosphoribosylaminopyrimidine deaminase/5-amino-6-(5-phosphoribosylamino)uracil reductase RibD [bacterium]
MEGSASDHHWMRRALLLARRQAGRTWPNPTVGCCIVRDGHLLGEAVHAGPGHPHAEAAVLLALAAHRIDPAGATAYITLEPCHHQGRTAPCSRALAEAGISRVVYAAPDDTPRHPGGGGAWLRENSVEVQPGVFGNLARELNHPFFETSSDSEPHLTLKLAMSADGALARRAGRIEAVAERAITGQRTRRRVHRMRAGANAVIVGAATARADHPRLDVRELVDGSWSGVQPQPVVLAGRHPLETGEVPGRALIMAGADGPRLPGSLRVLRATTRPGGRLDWESVLALLLAEGCGILLVEGGASVAADLLAERPPHRIHLYLAACGFGPGSVKLPGGLRLDDRYETLRARRLGSDVEWVLRRRDLG